jgi:hypothetical protein
MPIFRRSLVLALLVVAAGRASADPSDEVLRLVPADATICLLVQNAREHGKALEASPFAAWFPTSDIGKKLLDPKEIDKLRGVEQFLGTLLGVKLDELRDDVFGDAVAFAYVGGPPDKPDDDAGLILIRPRKKDVLLKLVDKLNDLQTQSGELKGLSKKTHRDRPYTSRDKVGGGAEFYAVVGDVVAYSHQERLIRAVLERDADKGASPIAAGLKLLGVRDKFAVAWLNPRWYDAAFAAQATATKEPAEKAFLAEFRKTWATQDAVAVFAHPAKNLELGVAVSFPDGQLPPLLAAFGESTELGAAVPSDAAVAVCGRADVPKLLKAVGAFLPEAARRDVVDHVARTIGPVFGKDKLPAVLRGIGPDFAAWATLPHAGAKTWVPEVTAVVKLRKDPDTGTDVPKAVAQAVELGAQLARVSYNQSHDDQIELSEETRDGVTVKFLASDKFFPPGVRPAFALRGDYLVLASSPDLVFRFAPPAPGTKADAPLVRVSASRIRAYVLAHADKAAGFLGREPAKDLAQLAAVLEVFDRFDLRTTATGGIWRFTANFDFAKPLGK